MHLSRDGIGNRLQLERKRLGLNQEEFAQKIGVAKRTLAGYEAGAADIGALPLSRAYEIGMDVMYVLSGKRSLMAPDALSGEETELVNRFRQLPQEDRAGTMKMVTAMAVAYGMN